MLNGVINMLEKEYLVCYRIYNGTSLVDADTIARVDGNIKSKEVGKIREKLMKLHDANIVFTNIISLGEVEDE